MKPKPAMASPPSTRCGKYVFRGFALLRGYEVLNYKNLALSTSEFPVPCTMAGTQLMLKNCRSSHNEVILRTRRLVIGGTSLAPVLSAFNFLVLTSHEVHGTPLSKQQRRPLKRLYPPADGETELHAMPTSSKR